MLLEIRRQQKGIFLMLVLRLVLATAFMGASVFMIFKAFLYLEDFQAYQTAGELTLAGESLAGMLMDFAIAAVFVIAGVIMIFWNKVKTNFQ